MNPFTSYAQVVRHAIGTNATAALLLRSIELLLYVTESFSIAYLLRS